ncbi:MAG: ABC transporter ATP-binding protein, partial [Erysipelotrichaceae bacterium]|nr:ABC transporter ATP-binding protein [Erysipelotrichaceae bacterium]
MLKRFISYYRPHRKLFISVMFIDLLMCVMNMMYPIINRRMLNDLIPNRKFDLIIISAVSLFVIYLFKAALKYLFDYYGHMCGTRIQADMRRELFAKLERLPFSFYDNNETGKVMSRIVNDLQEISELAHHGPENVFMAVCMLTFSFIYLGSISMPLTLIIFACIPVLIFITAKLRVRHMAATRKARASLAEINASVNSSISGIRVTKAFDNADNEMSKFEKGNRSFIDAKMGQYYSMSLFHASSVMVTDIFNVICLLCGGIFLYRGDITFGDYSTFIISIN